MNQKGFINILLIIIVVALVGAGAYFVSTRQVTTPTPSSTSTPSLTSTTELETSPAPKLTPSLTSTPIKKTDSQSLISITKTHLKVVRQTLPGAELFEVSSFIPFKAKLTPTNTVDLLIVTSRFVTTADNVSFIEVIEEFHNWEKTHYSTITKGFILGDCYTGGAAPGPEVLRAFKNCGKETGKPEQRDRHLPIQNWKVDLSDIIRVAKENNIQTGDITVATAGRVRNTPRSFTLRGSLLGQLPNDRTVVLVTGREGVLEKGISIADGRYVILNSENGTVLEKGTFTYNPPAP